MNSKDFNRGTELAKNALTFQGLRFQFFLISKILMDRELTVLFNSCRVHRATAKGARRILFRGQDIT